METNEDRPILLSIYVGSFANDLLNDIQSLGRRIGIQSNRSPMNDVLFVLDLMGERLGLLDHRRLTARSFDCVLPYGQLKHLASIYETDYHRCLSKIARDIPCLKVSASKITVGWSYILLWEK